MDFLHGFSLIRRVKSTPDPDTFEKYCDTPPISIAILLQKYALFLAESSIYTTNLYHDAPPICISILLQKYLGQGSLEHPQFKQAHQVHVDRRVVGWSAGPPFIHPPPLEGSFQGWGVGVHKIWPCMLEKSLINPTDLPGSRG